MHILFRGGRPRRPQPALVAIILALALWLPGTTLAADLFRGGDLYAEHCAECHGSDGRGEMPGTPDLTRGTTLQQSNAELFDLLENGRGIMPSYYGLLSDEEMLDVIAYLRTL